MIKHKRILLALMVGIIALVISAPVAWYRQTGDTPEEIEKVATALKNMYQNKDGIDFVPDWNEMEMTKITDGLTQVNKNIATAKALLNYDKIPIPEADIFDKIVWEDRFKTAKQPWEVHPISSKVLLTGAIAIGMGLVATLATLILLFVIPLIWIFMLQRISELSNAIQGKHDS